MPFSLDTSAILDAWVRHYPPDVFPTIWANMDASAKSGDILVVDEVFRELDKKDDGAARWVKSRGSMIVSIDSDIEAHVAAIVSKYAGLVDARKNRSVGDPWVIALARARNLTVVTAEKKRGTLTRPKIPDVCDDMNIACVDVVGFFRQQGWRV